VKGGQKRRNKSKERKPKINAKAKRRVRKIEEGNTTRNRPK